MYADSAIGSADVVLLSSVINDDFCGVSFAYSVLPPTELIVRVDGLADVWSSISTTTTLRWLEETVEIIFEDVRILENRSLLFVSRFVESEAGYITLDNITLHPCSDCSTPGLFAVEK